MKVSLERASRWGLGSWRYDMYEILLPLDLEVKKINDIYIILGHS